MKLVITVKEPENARLGHQYLMEVLANAQGHLTVSLLGAVAAVRTILWDLFCKDTNLIGD